MEKRILRKHPSRQQFWVHYRFQKYRCFDLIFAVRIGGTKSLQQLKRIFPLQISLNTLGTQGKNGVMDVLL